MFTISVQGVCCSPTLFLIGSLFRWREFRARVQGSVVVRIFPTAFSISVGVHGHGLHFGFSEQLRVRGFLLAKSPKFSREGVPKHFSSLS